MLAEGFAEGVAGSGGITGGAVAMGISGEIIVVAEVFTGILVDGVAVVSG
jgi:hypothetical protein